MVLQQGRAQQIEYYKVCAMDIDKKKRQILAKIFADVSAGETMELDDIMSALQEEYFQEAAEDLIEIALDRGIIDEREEGDYGIPIPSFHTWLVDEYAKGYSQDIHQTSKILPPGPTQALLPPPTKDDQRDVKI